MKRSNLLRIVVLSLLIPCFAHDLQAGGKGVTKYKRRCNPDYRYKARARAGCLLVSNNVESQWKCGQEASAHAEKWWNGSVGAEQDVWHGPLGTVMSGAVYKRICSRGEPIANYLVDTYDSEKEGFQGLEETQISMDPSKADYEHNTIELSGITGTMINNYTDVKTSFRLVIWKPSSEEDEEESPEKTVYEASISLLNGKLELKNFTSKEVSLIQKGNHFVLSLDNISKSIPFKDVKVEDLALSIITDAEPVAEQPMKQDLAASNRLVAEGKIDFQLMPNPAQDVLWIEFTGEAEQWGAYHLKIYDLAGAAVKEHQEGVSSKGTGLPSKVAVNIKDLKPGIYFVRVFNQNHAYLKKFVKQ